MKQMVHPRPQIPQGESVAKTETPLLIILSIVCKYKGGPWKLVQSVFKKNAVGLNILGRWTIVETVAHASNISY